jgi:hypothetical protein
MQLVRIRGGIRAGEDAAARAALDELADRQLTPEQARQRWSALGRLQDRAGEFDAAVRSFAAAQEGLPVSMPPLADPRPELTDALEEPAGAPWEQAPILLLGAPGSGVELIAALLADQPELTVLRGRASASGRDDDFNYPRFQHYCGELGEADREALRSRYLAPLIATNVALDRPLVDWLPRWDAHLLALVRRAMPGTRLVIVARDPRDELLNWLAFGWLPGFPCPDPEAAAAWLARAHRHLDHGAGLDDPQRLLVSSDAIREDPVAGSSELARLLGLESLQPGGKFANMREGLGGLPIGFAPGHWRRYEHALAAAFAGLGGETLH